jgi:SAM-dependent methyltransferase
VITEHVMSPPSDHLLRTLAAVPVSSNILDLGCGTGRHTEPLLRLGFSVHACDTRAHAVEATRARIADLVGEETAEQCVRTVSPDGFTAYPDDAFDWIVAFDPTAYLHDEHDLKDLLNTLQRLLSPGGWLYIAFTDQLALKANGTAKPILEVTPRQLDACAGEVGLAVSKMAKRTKEHGAPLVRAIYRYVTESTQR